MTAPERYFYNGKHRYTLRKVGKQFEVFFLSSMGYDRQERSLSEEEVETWIKRIGAQNYKEVFPEQKARKPKELKKTYLGPLGNRVEMFLTDDAGRVSICFEIFDPILNEWRIGALVFTMAEAQAYAAKLKAFGYDVEDPHAPEVPPEIMTELAEKIRHIRKTSEKFHMKLDERALSKALVFASGITLSDYRNAGGAL